MSIEWTVPGLIASGTGAEMLAGGRRWPLARHPVTRRASRTGHRAAHP